MLTIVTSGTGHVDIDALACGEAYGDCLNKSGDEAMTIFTPRLNASVPPMLRSLPMQWQYADECIVPSQLRGFAVMDVSNPQFFDPITTPDEILCVLDHHYGFADYWKARPAVASRVEAVGACATLVWEMAKERDSATRLNLSSYQLLLTAIVAHTLNFSSCVTTPRDIAAYNEILPFANVTDSWMVQYFREVSEHIIADPKAALLADQKHVGVGAAVYWLGQLELWDASVLLSQPYRDSICTIFDNESLGFANIISISEGINYMLADSPNTCELLASLIDGSVIDGRILKTNRMWLRKELEKLFMTK